MEEWITNIFSNENTYLMIGTTFCYCLIAWFLGFGIKAVIRLLYNILNAI